MKEWQVAVTALAQGDTILLLRKGGIRDAQGTFAVPQSPVWLFPTYEHQKKHLLKPAYADAVQLVPSGWHPDTVPLTAWAEITDRFVLPAAIAPDLLPFHIWTETFVDERLQWKPRSPLIGLLLRVYRLPSPHHLPYDPAYGGCRSWLNLPTAYDTTAASPVLSDAAYQALAERIRARVPLDLA